MSYVFVDVARFDNYSNVNSTFQKLNKPQSLLWKMFAPFLKALTRPADKICILQPTSIYELGE